MAKMTQESFRQMDEKLNTDPEFVAAHLTEVHGSWHFDWSGTEWEDGVKDLFGQTLLPTAYTALTDKRVVVMNLQFLAGKRLGKGQNAAVRA